MLTEQFRQGEVFGVVRRFNPRGGEMDKARYMKVLTGVYPEMKATLSAALEDLETITRIGTIEAFARTAVHIQEIEGLPFAWPAPNAASEDIDRAYQYYLYECPDLWDEIARLCDELDNPNGKVGAIWESLSDEEKKALRSLLSENGGGQNSGANSE